MSKLETLEAGLDKLAYILESKTFEDITTITQAFTLATAITGAAVFLGAMNKDTPSNECICDTPKLRNHVLK